MSGFAFKTTLQFFKESGQAVVMLTVFIFMISWILKAKPHNKFQNYSIVCYDIFGNVSVIDGLRIEFRVHDVAWSFMKHYKKSYPLYNFALISNTSNSEKKMIVKYI
ncbi:MAG: hypothetical protein WBV92_03765 [Nitrosotalea sp.]